MASESDVTVIRTAVELLEPGEEALVVNDSYTFEPKPDGTVVVGAWRIGTRADKVDWVIVYHPNKSTGVVSVWRGKLDKRFDAPDGKKRLRLRLTGRLPEGHTDQGFFAFVGGPGNRGVRYVP